VVLIWDLKARQWDFGVVREVRVEGGSSGFGTRRILTVEIVG
jgi:hypothetical protein